MNSKFRTFWNSTTGLGKTVHNRLPTRADARVMDVRADEPTCCSPRTQKEWARRGTPSGPVESGLFSACWMPVCLARSSAFTQVMDRAEPGEGLRHVP